MSQKQDVAIKVTNLSKVYKLYSKPIDRLKESLSISKKKYHKDFYALRNISFEIGRGEVVGIIGKNGSGKSTLLKLLTKVLTPTVGSIEIKGHVAAILELGAGFNPEMTGLENIYLNSYINGMKKNEINNKIDDIIAFSELGDFIHQPIKMYSSGMKARLAFAVSISVEPDILIVDEALSVGDAAFARKCFAKIEEIRANGATILFVSHSESSIVTLCSRAIWINSGEFIIDGLPRPVTGLYMKYTNLKDINIANIRSEYNELIQSERSVKNIDSPVMTKASFTEISSIYDKNLKPSSKLSFDINGAEIQSLTILDQNNNIVNILQQEKKYKICIECDLYETINDCRVGIAIKDTKGVYYSGAAYELLKHGKTKFLSGSTVYFEFDFDCLLVNGIFVIDVVILKNYTLKQEIAHRVNDLGIFKVVMIDKEDIIQSFVPMLTGFRFYENV